MGSKQKRRLARALAEHTRLNAQIDRWNEKAGLYLVRGQQLLDRERRLGEAHAENERLRDRLAEARRAADFPPPIIVSMQAFRDGLLKLPESRPSTGANLADCPPSIVLPMYAGHPTARYSRTPPTRDASMTTLTVDRVAVRVPEVSPMRDLIAWRLPAGIVLVDFEPRRTT